jgi:hypothetical protein
MKRFSVLLLLQGGDWRSSRRKFDSWMIIDKTEAFQKFWILVKISFLFIFHPPVRILNKWGGRSKAENTAKQQKNNKISDWNARYEINTDKKLWEWYLVFSLTFQGQAIQLMMSTENILCFFSILQSITFIAEQQQYSLDLDNIRKVEEKIPPNLKKSILMFRITVLLL